MILRNYCIPFSFIVFEMKFSRPFWLFFMRQLLKQHFDMDILTACNVAFCFVFPVSFLAMHKGLLAFLPAAVP